MNVHEANDRVTAEKMADKLDKIANAIAETVYYHDLAMSKYARERKVTWDDADYLRQFAKQLRGR